ncbi:sulfite reductase (NADPH) flavoprotein alpha-component [Mariniflexile fucanivorans]|uniref:NADPH--hemoprotein reductase n=1 Tax=Mariniflexile fucanivorans TaxID=264023 RepID=A0A4R1RCL6_9FLAO|nr:PepSY domain-containing protein [Mariniflexile fucanivorans]TCL63591.1 sulfite reductase (NADPH) flavoprotein alpha-component [Mariniflexile fucanivorans]
MLSKIWRFSHFYLTVSSFLFLLLAAVTGAFLAFEPIQEKLQPFHIKNAEDVSVAQLINTLKNKYDEVLDIEVDENYFVKSNVFSMDVVGDGQFYINPFDGNKIADIPQKNAFFEFLTNFHRSLFLETPGRIFVGIVCFLLFLIAITGLLLAIKRQGGFLKFCSKIINDKSIQYNHVALGRFMLIPIMILALSGTYLSMDRFSLLPDTKDVVNNQKSTPNKTISFSEFPIFKNTRLKDVQKLEFPFSNDEEDYFILNLHDKELKIHQKTGDIVQATNYPFTKILAILSFNLHTGKGSIIWSLILFLSSLAILYFMYSGSIIAYKRLRTKTKNKYKADEANFIILIGSENGSTKILGKIIQQALLKVGKKVFLDDLNNYTSYTNIEQLIIITSTYGEGEPPSNANLFLNKLQQTKITKSFTCHVIGLGSFSYQKFCEFAKKIHSQVLLQDNINVPATNPLLIHNQNYEQFRNWILKWSTSLDLNLEIPKELASKRPKETVFKVVDKQNIIDEYDETFTLTLTAQKRRKYVPGDLLAITPPNETSERLYSIGKNTKGDLLLSVKRHSQGVCSNYLNNLQPSQELKVTIKKNKDFYLPKKGKQFILIANGTGIAPFLGMIHQKSKGSVSLYWGTRTKTLEDFYKPQILQAIKNNTLQAYHVAFSKGESPYKYVQDLIIRDEEHIAKTLLMGGTIMICGSIAMRNVVFNLLEKICTSKKLKPLEQYNNNKQILTDCY